MASFTFKDKTVVLMLKVADLGGAERQALGLANYLIKHYKCKVIMVATHSNVATREFKDFAEASGVFKVHYFGAPSLTVRKQISYKNLKKVFRAFKYLNLMRREISKFKPDVIIPFLNTPSKIASLIYKSTGASLTFWHQLGLDTYMMDLLEKRAIEQTPFIIANSENGLDVFKKDYHVKNEKLFVLPQYVSINRIEKNEKKLKDKFNIKPGSIVIGMVAHYRKEKYQQLLLNAFAKVIKTKDVHLVFLGNKDNNEETLEKYNVLDGAIINHNLSNRVTLLSGESIEDVLNILDVGVLVSENEGTPNVVLEYMLYGLPVIATNHLGCIGVLGDSPFLIENDENVLAEKLNELVADNLLRIKEGKTNQIKIKDFSIERYFEKLTTIINSI